MMLFYHPYPTDEAIRKLAYVKWEAAGKPDGKDLDFWDQASRELHSKYLYNKTRNEQLPRYAKF